MRKNVVYMTEDETRYRLGEIMAKIDENRDLGMETRSATDATSVRYHLEVILRAGGGLWNEAIAKQYVHNLEANVGHIQKS